MTLCDIAQCSCKTTVSPRYSATGPMLSVGHAGNCRENKKAKLDFEARENMWRAPLHPGIPTEILGKFEYSALDHCRVEQRCKGSKSNCEAFLSPLKPPTFSSQG